MATPITVIWPDTAQRHLIEIHDRIAKDAPETAKRFVTALMASTDGLTRHPYRGHPLHEFDGPVDENPYREIHFRRYRILYRVSARQVIVIGVFHQSRQIDLNLLES